MLLAADHPPRDNQGAMPTLLALLRGINVGGHRKVPMTDLRSLCTGLGWQDVQTWIQSGNLVFAAAGRAAALESALERAIERHFGFHVDVVVRTAKQWSQHLRSNPFAAATAREPEHVLMALAKRRLARDAVAQLRERAGANERVEAAAGVLWLHHGGGIARSKLTPALLDRAAGSPVTARNWRTVQQLAAMAGLG
jgi:uncharacterized protein (DUF1697 family)